LPRNALVKPRPRRAAPGHAGPHGHHPWWHWIKRGLSLLFFAAVAVFDGFNVIDRPGNQRSGPLVVEEAVWQALQVGVNPDHQRMQDVKRHLMREPTIAITTQATNEIHQQQDDGDCGQGLERATPVRGPLNQTPDEQRRNKTSGGKQQAAGHSQSHFLATVSNEM
jgi:hypothetical protein